MEQERVFQQERERINNRRFWIRVIVVCVLAYSAFCIAPIIEIEYRFAAGILIFPFIIGFSLFARLWIRTERIAHQFDLQQRLLEQERLRPPTAFTPEVRAVHVSQVPGREQDSSVVNVHAIPYAD